MVTGATHLPTLVATTLIDAVDAATWAALGSAGITAQEARIILDTLWTTP